MTRRDLPTCDGPQALPADGGVATLWTILIGLTIMLLVAAVVAGGAVFASKTHGYDLAQSAARAGAQHIDVATYRTTGVLRLDPAQAATAAKQFLARAGATGSVTATTAKVTVTATSEQPTPMLRPLGVERVTVTATASATPHTGPAP